MHEMSYVRNVVDIVTEEAAASGVSRVQAVYLVIGEGRDIVEDYFEGLFRHLARGTVAENAEIVIHRVPYTMRCNTCGTPFHAEYIRREPRVCPCCGDTDDCTFLRGMEFSISSIEAAVDDDEEESESPALAETATAL